MSYHNSFYFNSDYSSMGTNYYKISYKIFILVTTLAIVFSFSSFFLRFNA